MPTGAHDFYLQYGGAERGFMLAKGEDGRKMWRTGLAPALAPQQRLSADNLYEGTPPEINTIFAAETFHGGAGQEDDHTGGHEADAHTAAGYAFSRGVDLSDEHRVYLSPKRQIKQQTAAPLDGIPTDALLTSHGLILMAGEYIYEWNTATGVWDERDDASTDGVNYQGKLVEHNGIIYAPRGSGAPYKYSTDGVTWVASNRAGDLGKADYFTTRGDDGDPTTPTYNNLVRLFNGTVSITVNGTNGSTAWSTPDTIGSTSETSKAVIEYDDALYIFKTNKVYRYDFHNVDDLWETPYVKSDNADHVMRSARGMIYANYGDRLLEFNPVDQAFKFIYPDHSESQEIQGSITGIGESDEKMFIVVTNANGMTYVMKGLPHKSWHTYIFPVDVDDTAATRGSNLCYYLGPGVMHTTNPVLLTGYGAQTAHYIQARANRRPEDDDEYEYETVYGTGGAYVVGPWINYGAAVYEKFLNRGTVLAKSMSAARTAILEYETEATEGTSVPLVTATYDGLSATNVEDAVKFTRLRYVVRMSTGAETQGPIVFGWTLQATLNIPRFRLWDAIVNLGPELDTNDNVRDDYQDPDELETFVFNAATQRVILTDRRGIQHTVKIHDFQNISMGEYFTGSDERDTLLYQIVMAEINALSTAIDAMIWDQDDWDSGKEWGV
jgi:hypothetical protein